MRSITVNRLDIMLRTFKLIVLFCLVPLVGCNTLAERYTAKEIGNQTTLEQKYHDHLDQKYSGLFNDRLKLYDELPQTNEKFIVLRREEDAKKRSVLKEEAVTVGRAVSDIKIELGRTSAKMQLTRARIKESEGRRIALEKKATSKDDQASALDELNDKIVQLNFDLELQQTEHTFLTEMLADRVQQMAKTNLELSTLDKRDYDSLADGRRRSVRNELVHEMLFEADNIYLDFKNQLLAGRAGADTVLDISELLISTATVLSGGAMAKANLGAASTLLKGSRTSFDKNFFAQQALASIINAMEDKRQVDKLAIITGLSKSTADYPLAQAVSDVRSYRSRASLMSGVLDVANQTATKSKESETRLLREQAK